MRPSLACVFLAFALGLFGCQPSEPGDGASAASDGPAYQFAAAWGESGSGPGQLREPTGVATAGGEVFVSDAGNHRVQVFGPAGQFRRQFDQGASGDTLARPMHLAARGSTLYVPEYLGDRVRAFSLQGQPQQTLGANSAVSFDAPAGVSATEAGTLYVADFFNHRVQVLGPAGDSLRQYGQYGRSGTAPGQFTYPTDVTATPRGGLVVADAYNHRIQAFGPDGSLRWMVPDSTTQAGSSPGRFNVATAVETGPQGRIYVADFFNHRIQVFSPDGTFLTAFGEQGSGEGQFERPVDMAFGEDGTLYVADFGNDRIQKFTPSRGHPPMQ